MEGLKWGELVVVSYTEQWLCSMYGYLGMICLVSDDYCFQMLVEALQDRRMVLSNISRGLWLYQKMIRQRTSTQPLLFPLPLPGTLQYTQPKVPGS